MGYHKYSDHRKNYRESSQSRHNSERRRSAKKSRNHTKKSVKEERSSRRYETDSSQRNKYSRCRNERQDSPRNKQKDRDRSRSRDERQDSRKNKRRNRSRSRTRSKSISRNTSKNRRDNSRRDGKNQASKPPEKKCKEIFELLEEIREELVKYLKSVFIQDVKPHEIFTRWYINSLTQGAKDYFMPKSFKALENDIAYYRNDLDSKVTPQDVISKVQSIWKQYGSQRYYIKPKDNLIKINEALHQRLRDLYTGPSEELETIEKMLLSAYDFMGTLNYHLSVPPLIFTEELKDSTELFGSPLNTFQPYCSLFEIEKKYFGSFGSFFEYEIQPGINLANPPFIENVIEQMADRLEEQLEKTPGITVICILPVWDPNSQKKYGLKTDGQDFVAYEKLTKSKFFQEQAYLQKFQYKFWDYYIEKHVPVSDCHLIALSNNKEKSVDVQKILDRWEEISSN